MQFTLPSGTDSGWLLLEQGALAGNRYRLNITICQKPTCNCGTLAMLCSPGADDSEQCGLTLEADLIRRRIVAATGEDAGSAAPTLADAVASEMTEAGWSAFREKYVAVKRHCTEHADMDQLEVKFPADVVIEGSMVGYYEILPFAKPVELTHGGQTWFFDDQYCVQPRCSCRETALSFYQLPQEGETSKTSLSFFYGYATNQIEPLSEGVRLEETAPALLAALREAQPDLKTFLTKRHATLRGMFQRALQRRTVRKPAAKPGRNDPCPCGSDKKFKKCCGA